VIWAILVLLGVPLWLCAIGILVMVFRNLRKRAADIPIRLRVDAKGRWHRGQRLWVHDVLGFRAAPRPGTRRCYGRPAVLPAS